ncbi:MAG TPA: trypsin-like peptidase domain-containing protein [Thermoanaerobaculia bacterium]|nr:trypsin-like peptidase domain-containing protein [Thermoanaerobaculia bacterium]
MLRPRFLLIAVLIVASGCRRDAGRGDDAQKMVAYAVKPAVVRISSIATAYFRYPVSAIQAVEGQLRADGYDLRARGLNDRETFVETGAGGSGSGFLIHPDGVILTSGHVVAPTRNQDALERDLYRNGAIAALVRHFPIETLRTIYREGTLDRYSEKLGKAGQIENMTVTSEVELSNGETLPYRILRWSPALHERGLDLALIQISRKGLPSLPLGDSERTRIGEAIFSVGYPAVASSSDEVIGGWLSRESDLEATFNPGTITAIKRNIANTPVLQSNVAIYRGNSGGPAVNLDGEVIGVSTWGHTNAEQIKFLVPVNVARQFIAEAGVKPSTGGAFNEHYRSALDAARDGEWVGAKKELARASEAFKKSPDLIRFNSDAERAIASMPLWRRHPMAGMSVAVLALAVLGMATFSAIRSRAPKAPPDLMKSTTVETVVAPTGTAKGVGSILGKFTILNGTRAGEKLGLGGSGIRIGRESAICEIVLENPKVSRLHAEVVSIDGKVLLIDRNSSNGTYVNDHKIDKRFLQDGDIIYFGGRNAVAVAFHA